MTIKEINESVSVKQVFENLLPTYEQGNQTLSKTCPCGKTDKKHNCALNEDKFVKCFTAGCDKTFDQISLYTETKGISVKEATQQIKQDFNLVSTKKPTKNQVFISEQELLIIKNDLTSPLHNYLEFLGIPRTHILDWAVGSLKGNTYFLEKDKEGRVWNFQAIKYNDNGKRIKEPKEVCFSKPQPKDGQNEYKHLPYGFHLIDINKPTYIVEGNKTAVIASHFYPDYNFVACQSASGLTVEKIKLLLKLGVQELIWLCDADKAGRKNSSLDNLKMLTPLKSYVVDLFPDRDDGYDLADAIIDNLRPDLLSNKIPIKEWNKPVIIEAVKEELGNKFWAVFTKGKKSYLDITKPLMVQFLENEGFAHILVSNSAKTQLHELILNKDNVCTHIQRKGVIDYVENYLNAMPEVIENLEGIEVTREELGKILIENGKELFSQSTLDMIVTKHVDFLKDTQNTSYKFYKNTFVSITKDEVKTLPYSKLPAAIWKNQILSREFHILADENIEDCIWNRFLTCTQKSADNFKLPERLDNLYLCIGYLLHSYKSSYLNKIIFATDFSFLESEQGGNGKSIVFKTALEKMMPICYIDGKNWKKDGSFPFQLLEDYHKVITINDLAKDFDLERVFNVATDDMVKEKKNQSAYVIPFAESPKMAMTGNLPVRGTTNAHTRRLQIVEFSGHFNKNHTPHDEFGKALFEDFDEYEWLQFDNCMIQFLQKWLSELKFSDLIGNYDLKKLYNEVPQEICDYFEKTLIDGVSGIAVGEFAKEDLIMDYNDLYIVKNEKNYQKSGMMTKLLKKFLSLKGINPLKYTDKRFPYLMTKGNKEVLFL